MKKVHLLRVELRSDLDAFRGLIDAVRADGGRVGWLRWHPDDRAADKGPSTAGLLRHVEVDAAGSMARKPRTGPAVLRDVVREHFRGCRVVLVAGEASGELAELARLAPSGEGFRIESEESVRELAVQDLVSRLRRPRVL